MMISWHGILLKELQALLQNIRTFSYHNKSVIEFIFILTYSMEQAILIYLTFKVKDNTTLILIISIFAVIILTTFSLQKLIMESRIRILENKVEKTLNDKMILEKSFEETISFLPKDLNNYKPEEE